MYHFYFILIKLPLEFVTKGPIDVRISLDNGLAMIRRQAIVWTNKWQLLISFHEKWSPVYLVPSGWRYQFDHLETPSQQGQS